jgi:signal transduction histidine kinase
MPRRFQRAAQRIAGFFQSIRFRMTIWSVVILAIILLVFSAFVYARQKQDLRMQEMAQLQVKYHELITLYHSIEAFEPNSSLQTEISGLASQTGAILSANDVWALTALDGTPISQSSKSDPETVAQIVQYAKANHADAVDELIPYIAVRNYPLGNGKTDSYFFLMGTLSVNRRPVGWMILGTPLDPNHYLTRLAFTLLLASLATLALLLGGGYWLAGRALAPVRAITRTARDIGETDLHKRLRLKQKDELGELASTFDDMLDRLEAAFIRQRQFTADASHELRTPLAIIGLEADQVLTRRRTPEEYEHSLKLIRSENELMARLVNELLTLARMDAGQIVLKREPLDLSEVALDVIERLSSLARRDGVELEAGEFPEVKVEGDYQYLSQMLLNLVQNAIKYAGGRGHHVKIETGCDGSGLAKVAWVKVEDDGPGISSEHIPHLFERFYRVDKSRSRPPEIGADPLVDGSGLGLAIVRWIAMAHDGQVSVQSVVGQGTTFEVTLPV